jgi:hypothetical protein
MGPRDRGLASEPVNANQTGNELRVVALVEELAICDSFEARQRAAFSISLVQSCALAGVSPFEYLKDLLLESPTHAATDALNSHRGRGPSADLVRR